MKITPVVLTWWQQRRVPSWASKVQPQPKDTLVTIDTVINAQCGIRLTDSERSALNTCSLVAMKYRNLRRQHDDLTAALLLYSYLVEIGENPGTTVLPAKRGAMARRWAKRLLQSWNNS